MGGMKMWPAIALGMLGAGLCTFATLGLDMTDNRGLVLNVIGVVLVVCAVGVLTNR